MDPIRKTDSTVPSQNRQCMHILLPGHRISFPATNPFNDNISDRPGGSIQSIYRITVPNPMAMRHVLFTNQTCPDPQVIHEMQTRYSSIYDPAVVNHVNIGIQRRVRPNPYAHSYLDSRILPQSLPSTAPFARLVIPGRQGDFVPDGISPNRCSIPLPSGSSYKLVFRSSPASSRTGAATHVTEVEELDKFTLSPQESQKTIEPVVPAEDESKVKAQLDGPKEAGD